jgi:hypothetical protein
MTTKALFDKTSTFGSGNVISIVNRMQMLYFILIFPKHLIQPSMILGIVIIGLVSQINMIIFSKWLTSKIAANGYEGFIQLFGVKVFRIFVCFGLFLVLVKITVFALGYVEVVHHLIFPSMNTGLLVSTIMVVCFYLSSQGMEKTIRFGIIAFLCTIWIIIFYIPFFFPPIASLHHLYPLIPTSASAISWKGLFMVGASLSGPEYLICVLPWMGRKEKMKKSLMIANALSVFEYLLLFIVTLLFFGPNYVREIDFPVLNMTRYLQSPFFERIDIILISLHMFHLVFMLSFLLLCFYGGIRIVMNRLKKPTTRIGLIGTFLIVSVFLGVINAWFWHEENDLNFWPNLQVWLGTITYLAVPTFLLAATKLKGGKA